MLFTLQVFTNWLCQITGLGRNKKQLNKYLDRWGSSLILETFGMRKHIAPRLHPNHNKHQSKTNRTRFIYIDISPYKLNLFMNQSQHSLQLNMHHIRSIPTARHLCEVAILVIQEGLPGNQVQINEDIFPIVV